jgi:hypothetical protein
MPRNRSHTLVNKGGRPMNTKTPICREFEKDVESRLKEFQGKISNFLSNFDKNKHYISAEYYLYTPRDILFTAGGYVSSRNVDTDAHKVFRDVIYRCIGLDDKLERDSRFFTPVSHDEFHNVVAIFKLERIECLTNTSSLTQNITGPTKEGSMLSALL